MRDPREIFTEEGLREYFANLHNLELALFFLTNNADDLALGVLRGGAFLECAEELVAALHLDGRVLRCEDPHFEYMKDED